MDLGLRDRVAIVMGGSTGLGRAVALELAREGMRVAVVARDEARLRTAAEEIAAETGADVLPLAADATDPEAADRVVAEVVRRWGTVHVAMANAGGPPSTTFETTTAEQVVQALELNLMSAVRLALAAVPHMKEQRWGRFVALTSMTVKQPMTGLILSNTSRPGVVGFVKSMATELAPFGITCNVVAPGFFRTARTEELARSRAGRENRPVEEVSRDTAARIPALRMGEPEELAALVAFLASERAGYLTGATIQVDGGYTQGLL